MQITVQNVRPFVRQTGWTVTEWCGPRTLKNWLHDNTYRCTSCEGLFTESDEVDDGTCTGCAKDWAGFDARREWGTY